MSVRTLELMPDHGGSIASSARVTFNVPRGRSIEAFYLYATDGGVDLTEVQLGADLTEILVSKDGDPIIKASATALIAMRSFYGDGKGDSQADDGVLPINFALPYIRTVAGERNLKLGTEDVRSLNVEVEFQSGVLNVDALKLYAERSSNEPMGIIRTIRQFPQNFTTTGDHEVSDLRRNPRDALAALHIEYSTGTLDETDVSVNNVSMYRALDTVNDNALKRAGRTPQSGYRHLDFIRSNSLTGALPFKGVEDLRVKNTWSGAAPNAHTFYLETLEGVA